MTRERKWFLSISFFVFIALAGTSVLIFQPRLETIHKIIKQDYESVSHINASEFSELSSNDVVVFDVREPAEFAVSHIEGAIQVAPDIDPNEFIEDYGELLEGKQVVFYCSVGRRSSYLASKLGNTPFEHGAKASLNLTGGVFTWVNQGRQLRSSNQRTTSKVHPYNDYWGRLVEDKTKLSYAPE